MQEQPELPGRPGQVLCCASLNEAQEKVNADNDPRAHALTLLWPISILSKHDSPPMVFAAAKHHVSLS